MKNYRLYLIFALFFAVSCNKDGAGCFDKAGDIKIISIDVPAFTEIDVSTNVDIQLLTDGVDRVEIETGENLIPGINLVVEKGVLKIENLNTCFWSNGYTHPVVKIRNTALEKVIQHGYGNIFSEDTIKIEKLTIQIEDASGGVNLLLDANNLRLVSNSLGPITLRGQCVSLNANHSWGDGILYAKDLVVNNCKISQSGSNRMEINVLNDLQGSINNYGNVYLFNQKPTTISVELTSQGKIIEQY